MADASTPTLGAGTYRVNKGETLRYRGASYKGGDRVEMTDAGAGAHFRKVTKVTDAEITAAVKAEIEKAVAGKAEAEKADAKKTPAKS